MGKLWEFGSWLKKAVSDFELWSNPEQAERMKGSTAARIQMTPSLFRDRV